MSSTLSKFSLLLLICLIGSRAFAFEDPTRGEPFLPWAWDEQLKPTIEQSTKDGNLSILALGALGSIGAYQYDDRVFEHNRRGENLIMSSDTASAMGIVGGGGLSVGVAALQVWVDQTEGLRHMRAIVLTSASHVMLAFVIGRERPGGREDFLPFKSSYPSGHAANVFTSATSLASSYGYAVGIPAYAVATAVAVGRVSENTHWLSDVIGGAALGVFWARASHAVQSGESDEVLLLPAPHEDGYVMSARWAW